MVRITLETIHYVGPDDTQMHRKSFTVFSILAECLLQYINGEQILTYRYNVLHPYSMAT